MEREDNTRNLISHSQAETLYSTLLPTFMPVTTQAAIKGLTSQQMEDLGVTLILNNTYHLNLRPGIKVLREAGGAHKFQGWRKNLLTVIYNLYLLFIHAPNIFRTVGGFS